MNYIYIHLHCGGGFFFLFDYFSVSMNEYHSLNYAFILFLLPRYIRGPIAFHIYMICDDLIASHRYNIII